MVFRRRRLFRRFRFKRNAFGKRFRRRGNNTTRRFRRIASNSAWKVVKRASELKYDHRVASTWPAGTLTAQGTIRNYVTTSFGNVQFPSGVGNIPLLMDITHAMNQGANQFQVVGNKILLHKFSLEGNIQTVDNQLTFDEWMVRITVLRFKTDPNTGSPLSETTIIRNQYIAINDPNGNSWFNRKWDRKKVKIYKDMKFIRHAMPTTVSPQTNVHFKAIPLRINLRWKRGRVMQFNPSNSLDQPATQLVMLHPIAVIFQSGAIMPDDGVPISNPLPAHFTSVDSAYYLSWRDL